VVLDVTQVHADIHSGCNFIVLVASLCEAAKDVRLASKKLHQAHDILTQFTNLTQECLHVVTAGNEDLVLNIIRAALNRGNDRSEAVDNVVTAKGVSRCAFGGS
jgi:hypothetical protein